MPFIHLILICLVLLGTPAVEAAGIKAAGPSPKDKCPVCGMFVSKYPDWATSVTFKDGTSLHFDGAKDFFTFFLNMKKYTSAQSQATVESITLKDYYTLKNIDARKAFFVTGSDVYGPMGKELVPFGKASDAQSFLNDHRGKKVYSFDDVSRDVLKTLE